MLRPFVDLGSYNVQRDVQPRVGVPAVMRLLDHLDVLAVQEGDAIRDHLRDRVADLRHPWRMTKGARSILWRPDVLELDALDQVQIATGRRVGVVPGRRSVLPDYYAAVARFSAVADSAPDRLTVLNVHMPAHSRFGGPREAMWDQAEHALAQLLRTEAARAHGWPVVVLGDWNRPLPHGDFSALRNAGARCCWDGVKRPDPTHGRDTIDGAWVLSGRFETGMTSTAHQPHKVGDHSPVICRLIADKA